MQTRLTDSALQTGAGQEADEILRNCVHCGFCNATCPTYQLLGDELDGPRGRIYLIKQVLEGHTPTRKTQLHLDRCLTCRACETTCPSGVDYHRLLDTGRALVDAAVRRSAGDRLMRAGLRMLLPWPRRFTPLLRLGQMLRPVLPAALKRRIPARHRITGATGGRQHPRSMLLLDGCVQPALAPRINAATRRVLDAFGITTVVPDGSGCCGALSHHLNATDEALGFVRRNIDAWWPAIEAGAEALVITASGCAPMVKDYGRLLAGDAAYAARASRVSSLARDISEIVAGEQPDKYLLPHTGGHKVAFHSPCSLQHAQQLNNIVENILSGLGFDVAPVTDSHLCCGSAGTYSILQPGMAARLRDAKLEALQADHPDVITTANIGCLTHMSSHAQVPLVHWIELLEPLIPQGTPDA